MKTYEKHTDLNIDIIIDALAQAGKPVDTGTLTGVLTTGPNKSDSPAYSYVNTLLREGRDMGYIERDESSKPYTYALTDKGLTEAGNAGGDSAPNPVEEIVQEGSKKVAEAAAKVDAARGDGNDLDAVLEENADTVEELPEPAEEDDSDDEAAAVKARKKHTERISEYTDENGWATPDRPTAGQGGVNVERCVYVSGPVNLPTDDEGYVEGSAALFGERKKPEEVNVKCPCCGSIRPPKWSSRRQEFTYKWHTVSGQSFRANEPHFAYHPKSDSWQAVVPSDEEADEGGDDA